MRSILLILSYLCPALILYFKIDYAMKLRKIEILESDNNKKGDLFGRLMSDLFHTLGYDEPRLNIHKSGRELDLIAYHRTENKIAVAECKAHNDKIGGDDINKFVGIIDGEKRKAEKDGKTAIGYFISLSGFKETAIEQEREFDNKRIVLIRSDKLVEELIHGRILVPLTKAISLLPNKFSLLLYADLFAYHKGWVWVLYYSDNGQTATHFALVHAEGKSLVNELAQEVINIDSNINGLLDGLDLINDENSAKVIAPNLQMAKNKYFEYLQNELGEIQFEGLPTDKEAGTVKVKLENIFVPLHLNLNKRQGEVNLTNINREGIGSILEQKNKLAILARPGAGKSTLLKRVAIAYAFPERRKEINDKLPDKNWFPIFLRCRELGEKVTLSITDIINGIPVRAEIPSYSTDFSAIVSSSLQNGEALLLIDGLDEISEDRNRIAFVNQLRTFIATYPTINIIVTSREAGFRTVAGSLATYCENYIVSSLNDDEIEQLSFKWHKAIIDNSDSTVREAAKLTELILNDGRIKVLAENPLLLTTLLFVKRWAGYLPTKRSILYQEMIKLLLVTWNVEGHEILDIEEAEPQLAYIAYWMTINGLQRIDAEELNKCLIEARRQLPEILGYTNISPSEFIKRVELRSSLLILSGHKKTISGNIMAEYEFLHLSFQEYLTAKAIVKKFIPTSHIVDDYMDIIMPNINNETWKEIIPLIAVLLERDCKKLIDYLVEDAKTIAEESAQLESGYIYSLTPSLLGNCLANEVQINPVLLDDAIEWYAKNIYSLDERIITDIILNNKFGTTFRNKIQHLFFDSYDDVYFSPLGSCLSDIFLSDLKKMDTDSVLDEIHNKILSGNRENKCIGILALMSFAYGLDHNDNFDYPSQSLEPIFSEMFSWTHENDIYYEYSISWSIVWTSERRIFPETLEEKFTTWLISVWYNAVNVENLKRIAAWALCKIIRPSYSVSDVLSAKMLSHAIDEGLQNPSNEYDETVAACLNLLLGNYSNSFLQILQDVTRGNDDASNNLVQFTLYFQQQ